MNRDLTAVNSPKMRIALVTLGCKLNFIEAEELGESFVRAGHEVVPFGHYADITVVHTCTVTGRSDFKSRHLISRARKASPTGRIVVTGCYAELDPETLRALPGVAMVVGRAHLHALPALVSVTPPVAPDAFPSSLDWPVRRATRLSRAFLKIQTGCDQRCTFCRVWQARGPARSVPLDTVLEQARIFLDQGFEELVLAGVDMGSWGNDLGMGRSFGSLMERIAGLPGRFRIRLSSIYPIDIDARLFELVTSHPRLCRHLHLPLQSASPGVLRRMGRHVDPARLCALTWRLREAAGRFGIGADIIAGFPGETEEDFAATCRFIEESALTYLHVFPFSARPGTAAAGFADHHAPEVIKERARVLRALGAAKRAAYRASHPGGEVEVLVERRRDRATGLLTGFTTDYIRIWFEGLDAWMGRLAQPALPAGLPPRPAVSAIDDSEG